MNNFDIISYLKKEYIDTNVITNNDLILLAVSGGKDSMCLLWSFIELNKLLNGLNIKTIHINHSIRDEESDRDEKFVKEYCKNNNIDFISKKIDCIKYSKENKLSLEESARILRYKAINDTISEISHQYNKTFIVLAHHKKDQVETIIHNILRGSGISGLVGMKRIQNNIIRPFIDIDKQIIDDIVETNKIPFVIDSTNNDDTYTRNYIRNNILDEFNKINTKYQNHIIDLSKDIREIDEYLFNIAEEKFDDIVKNNDNEIIIDCKMFKNNNHIVQIYIIKLLFEKTKIPKKDFTRVHIEDIIDIIIGNNNRHLDLPYKLTIDKNNNLALIKFNETYISMDNKKRG